MEKMSNNGRVINWFEIPVLDMPRAVKFYEATFDVTLVPFGMPGMQMFSFPADDSAGATSGALVKEESVKPGSDGVTIYLNANPDIAQVVGRAEVAGAQIIVPKTFINDEIGYFAIVIDSEGNRIGLHAEK